MDELTITFSSLVCTPNDGALQPQLRLWARTRRLPTDKHTSGSAGAASEICPFGSIGRGDRHPKSARGMCTVKVAESLDVEL